VTADAGSKTKEGKKGHLGMKEEGRNGGGRSLDEEIAKAFEGKAEIDPDVVWEIRKRRENRTGIPMEEDDIGKRSAELLEDAMPEVSAEVGKLKPPTARKGTIGGMVAGYAARG